MDALILAAGLGSRLGGSSPKCLCRMGDSNLLQIQIETLRRAGVDRVTVVVGYRYRDVVGAVPGDATFVLNEGFASTNSIYSFHLAAAAIVPGLSDDLFVVNSDVLFPLELVRRVAMVPGSAFAFDSSSGHDDEHMKVHLRDGDLLRMSKALPASDTAGENVGVLRLDPDTALAAFRAAATLVEAGQHQEWLGAAVSRVATEHRIRGVDVAGLPWVEIDYPEDLALARDQIWPAIDHLDLIARRSGADGSLRASYAEAVVA